MKDQSRIKELIEAHLTDQINRKDFDELHRILLENKFETDIDVYMKQLMDEMELTEELQINSSKIYDEIINHPDFAEKKAVKFELKWYKSINNWSYVGIAGAMVLVFGLLFYFYDIKERTKMLQSEHTIAAKNIYPDGVVLTMADGTSINLDSVKGSLPIQGNSQIILNEDGLTYNSVANPIEGNIPLNSITTSKGKQYLVILPDGTKVWLNASSTISYPVAFNRKKRIVDLNGEAYFEVVKDQQHPFIVKSKLQEVEVLGTSFNISSYDDDNYVKTTLVEGKVSVSYQLTSVILKPGQQSTIVPGTSKFELQSVDTDEVVSWKRGLFVFNNEEIREVMKKVSRWYDIHVEYEDGIEGKRIGGSIQRFDDFNKIMESLQATGLLKYKMEGRRVIIMK